MAVVSKSRNDASGLHTQHSHLFKRDTINVGTIIENLQYKETAISKFGMDDKHARKLTPETDFR